MAGRLALSIIFPSAMLCPSNAICVSPVSLIRPFQITFTREWSELNSFIILGGFIAAKTLLHSLCFVEEARSNSQLPPPDHQHDSHDMADRVIQFLTQRLPASLESCTGSSRRIDIAILCTSFKRRPLRSLSARCY